jgi:hypothetical protein
VYLGAGYGGSAYRRVVVRHDVVMVEPVSGAIALPDGTLVRGRGRREALPVGALPDYGLYLGLPTNRRGPDRGRGLFRRDEPWRPDWAADWIDWLDFGTRATTMWPPT